MNIPVLYSFRRCPYAIRARLAIAYSGSRVELREILLRDKPASMLAISPKGTVPVLQLADGRVLDESLDVMHWALQQNDPEGWDDADHSDAAEADRLISLNDGRFKHWLDRYKYADRYPGHSREDYRGRAEPFLQELGTRLESGPYLRGSQPGIADMAIVPFVRQFAAVDCDWFQCSAPASLNGWLQRILQSTLFAGVMQKYPRWQPGQDPVIFGGGDHPS